MVWKGVIFIFFLALWWVYFFRLDLNLFLYHILNDLHSKYHFVETSFFSIPFADDKYLITSSRLSVFTGMAVLTRDTESLESIDWNISAKKSVCTVRIYLGWLKALEIYLLILPGCSLPPDKAFQKDVTDVLHFKNPIALKPVNWRRKHGKQNCMSFPPLLVLVFVLSRFNSLNSGLIHE